MTTRTKVSNEVKAAVLADLVVLGPAAVAAKHGINPNTVRRWKSENNVTSIATIIDRSVKKEQIGALLLEYLEANLNALIAQAYVTADPNYIIKQSAENLAILHGVLGDKGLRLLEAFHAGHEAATVDAD